MPRFLSIVVLLCIPKFLAPQNPPLKAGDTAYSTAPVALRVEGRPTARSVASLPAGTPVVVRQCSRGWCGVKGPAQAGYVLAEYLSMQRPPEPVTPVVQVPYLVGGIALALILLGLLALRYRGMVSQFRLYRERFRGVVDAEVERNRILEEIKAGQLSLRDAEKLRDELQSRIQALQRELVALDEEDGLRSVGFYKPHYAFEHSESYQVELERIRDKQKAMLKEKTAAVCPIEWTVNGSVVEGRKQIKQTLRLILRAFNGESDAAVAKVTYANIKVMEARIQKSWEALNKLVEVQQCRIVVEYLDLKLQELHLAHEYEERLQKDKEEQRLIKERMRDEEIARREIEKARLQAEKEETQYQEALVRAREEAERAVGEQHDKLAAKVDELERLLAEAHTNKERAMARAQMTRSGHVYVISNIGSFGEEVFKIGMTRRLDPFERIRELGDASVPFEFDVHAVIFSDDAPTLESTLHSEFDGRRINLVNERKEFFGVSIHDIAQAVKKCHGDIQITLAAEARDYRKTLAMRAANQQPLPGGKRETDPPIPSLLQESAPSV